MELREGCCISVKKELTDNKHLYYRRLGGYTNLSWVKRSGNKASINKAAYRIISK
jgi:hypothetical protein